MRPLLVIALGLCCLATSCSKSTAIAVSPDDAGSSENAERIAFEVVRRISTEFRLEPFDPGRDRETHRLKECFSDQVLFVCGKTLDREVQFQVSEVGTRRFTARADSLKRALLGGLRAQFGETNVRECEWKALGGRDRRVGCPQPGTEGS